MTEVVAVPVDEVVAEQPVDEPPRAEPRRTVFRLRFDDGDLAGQEVYVRLPTAGGKIDLAHATTEAALPDLTDVLTEVAAAERMYRIFRAFAASLQSWSLTDGSEEVPPTLEGLLAQEWSHAVAMAYAWLDAIADHATATAELVQDRATVEAELQLPVEALA